MGAGAERLGGVAHMIDRKQLTADLRRLVRRLEVDIRDHAETTSSIRERLRRDHARARDAGRTGEAFEGWRDDHVTLAAVAWVLACVFVRFCEDTELIAEARLAGPGDRLTLAQDTTRHFFQQRPDESDREYLLWCFSEASRLPDMRELFDERHNPLHELPPSVDGASELLAFWRRTDPESGQLVHDFSDPDRDTRFLGDLYQDLSDDARKRYALLQTPEFIEWFILDRTLNPAIEEFGLGQATLIDPACGSGHFLLGAFSRLLARWHEREPGSDVRALCQRVFDQIAGVDVNPYATAIARFRLLVAALTACQVQRISDAPDFHMHLTTGDSLLHGHRPGQLPGADSSWARPEHQHFYDVEDADELRGILDRRYAAVVANPPYITPKDPALRDAYRDRYETCYRAYSLSVPFTERLFDLAQHGTDTGPAGFVGQITANSFMKREFGKRLVEQFLTRWDLTQLIDTAGVYIPGHGTPTLIMIARARPPVSATVRGVLGIRGEPSTPIDPARGKVWMEILELVNLPGSEGEFVSVEDIARERLAKHPWSLQGGGASVVAQTIENASACRLTKRIQEIGFGVVTREDEVYRIGRGVGRRSRIPDEYLRPLVAGDDLRDWSTHAPVDAIWPYRKGDLRAAPNSAIERFLWPWRTQLSERVAYGRTQLERGLSWWEYSMFFSGRFRKPLSIAFAFVATHNHFVLDHGGAVFNRSAPIIKLPSAAGEEAHLALLGPLNSSTGCFWLKQMMHNKGSTVDQHGARQTTVPFEDFWEIDGTKLKQFPVPTEPPVELARALDEVAHRLGEVTPSAVLDEGEPSGDRLRPAQVQWESERRTMIALQEELDWWCYRVYGLIEDDLRLSLDELPEVALGERAFEIVLARKLAAGEVETTWFERHGSTPVTELPIGWPKTYRELVKRRIEAIEQRKAVGLIERPEYKRRWQTESWDAMQRTALRAWLLDRLEARAVWPEPRLARSGELADRLLGDTEFQQACALYASGDAEPQRLVAELLEDESVPYLAALRYATSGIGKRALWERTWEAQRAEDAIDKLTLLPEDDSRHLDSERAKTRKANEVGTIDPPPRYVLADFRSPSYWRQRGKLDVPKERFTSYPDAAIDGSDLFGWAGWDYPERAQALAGRIVEAYELQGMEPRRLWPLLAGLAELLPWLRQWHGEPDPRYGMPLSDFYEAFLDERARSVGATLDDLKDWRLPERVRERRRVAA
jgi:hypothetical protein